VVSDQPSNATSSAVEYPTTPKPADVPTKKFFTGEFDTGKALELIYGSYDSQKKYSKWKITKEDIQRLLPRTARQVFSQETVYTAANFASHLLNPVSPDSLLLLRLFRPLRLSRLRPNHWWGTFRSRATHGNWIL